MNLELFFEVQFDDPNINRLQLRKFSEDHLKRMATNNEKNLYDLLLTDTQAAYEKYFGALDNNDVSNALKESRTKSVDNIKLQFAALVSKRAGLVTNSFDKDSPEYQEFFPHGLTEYSHATLEDIETLMNRMITASTTHADVLGNSLSLEFGKMKDSFLVARGQQIAQKGTVSKTSNDSEEARHELEIQLTKNLLTIALNNIGNVGAAAMFFDKSIISRPAADTASDQNEPPPAPVK